MTYTSQNWHPGSQTNLSITDVLSLRAMDEQLGRVGSPWIDATSSFGADNTGSVDATTPIQNAINALPSTGGTVYLPAGTYKINSTLDIRDKPNVVLQGAGAHHDVYFSSSALQGTILKRTSGTGTMLICGTTTAQSNGIKGQKVIGMNFDASGLAATAIQVVSLRGGTFDDIHIREATSVALDLTTVSLSGEENVQDCEFRHISIREGDGDAANGIGIRLTSAAGVVGNTSLNNFTNIFVCHYNGNGIELRDCDSNTFHKILTQGLGGSGIGVVFYGSDGSIDNASGNTFTDLQAASGVLAKAATGGGALHSDGNFAKLSQVNSGGVDPVVEDGAGFQWIRDDGQSVLIRPYWRVAFHQRDEFIGGLSNSSGNIGELGWSASGGTWTSIAPEANHPGIYRLDTGASSGTMCAIFMGAVGTGGFIATEMFDIWVDIRLNNTDTDTLARLGVMNNGTSNPSSSGIFIEKLEADGSWYGVTRSGGVQTRTAALSAVDTNFRRVRIRRIDGSTIGFTFHNSGVEVTSTTNIPTGAVQPFVQIRNNVASSKTLDIDSYDLAILGLGR